MMNSTVNNNNGMVKQQNNMNGVNAMNTNTMNNGMVNNGVQQEIILPELKNVATIIGKVKDVQTFSGVYDGVKNITVILTIESNTDGKVHENRVTFKAKESSKLYKGYETMSREYKEQSPRVSITGSFANNRYTKKDTGDFKDFDTLKGMFCNRLKDNDETPDQIGLIIEGVIVDMKDDMTQDGIPTGGVNVRLVTCRGQWVTEVRNVIVGKELAQGFKQYYKLGQTAEFFLKYNRCVVVSEQEQQQTQAGAFFGQQLDVMPSTIQRWESSIELIGGQPPKMEGAGALTQEQIREILAINDRNIEKAKATVPTTPPQATASFGTANPFGSVPQSMPSPIAEGEMPF